MCTLNIIDIHGKMLSQVQTGASAKMKWSIGWMKNQDIVVLYSTDIEIYAYKIENNTLKNIKATSVMISRGTQLKNLEYTITNLVI